MNAIPGFKGYREQRAAPRRRPPAARAPRRAPRATARRRSTRLAAAATRGGDLDVINDIETARKRLDKVANRVRYADRGYSGFFDAVKVDEAIAGQRSTRSTSASSRASTAIARPRPRPPAARRRAAGRRRTSSAEIDALDARLVRREEIRAARHQVGGRDGGASRGHPALRRLRARRSSTASRPAAPPTSSSARSSSSRTTSGRSSTATARPSTPSRPGRHTLTTLNLPLLGKLIGLPFGGKSPFQAQVYFISRQTFTDLKWGTKEPITFRDSELTMVRLRAFGRFSMRVADPQIFLQQLVGTKGSTPRTPSRTSCATSAWRASTTSSARR